MLHPKPLMQFLLVLLAGIILSCLFLARSGRDLFIRRIPGLAALEEAVGRATEMGRPILFSPGLGGLDVVTLQAISIASYVMKLSARYNTRVITAVGDSTVYPVVHSVARDTYTGEGRPELLTPEDVRYISDRQFAYASGCIGIMNREKVAANFFFGTFYAEALILAESGRELGAIQIAGTPSVTQIPFLIAACDYTIIGEEYYAATAYLTREPTLLGSLVGQDWSKIALLAFVLFGVSLASIGATGLLHGIQGQLGLPGAGG